jgi:hypothetical protein
VGYPVVKLGNDRIVDAGRVDRAGDQSAPRLQGLNLLAPPATVMDSSSRVIYPATATGGDPPWTGPRYEVDGDVGQWSTAVQAHLIRSH